MAGNGLRLLSFDCGGVRSLSQLKIMENVMHRIKYDRYPNDPDVVVLPCECFDAMGGSDTGGIIVIMFCKLRMSVEDTIEEFYQICVQVYADGLSPEERTNRLRKCAEDLLKKRNLPLDLKMGKDDRVAQQECPCFVVATPRDNINKRIHLRSYATRAQPASKATVVETILATCATQPDFLPISIGPLLSRQDLIGGAMGGGNPCRELVLEAHDLFGKDLYVATILSIGSGHLGTLSARQANATKKWADTLRQMVQDCEKVDQEMKTQVGHLGVYHRLSVDQGLQQMYGLDLEYINSTNTQTQTYLGDVEVSRRIDHCVESLRLRQGQVTLEQLKHSRGAQPIYKGAPPLSSYFVLRTEPREKMIKGLVDVDVDTSQTAQKVLVISGMGGCGKTQLVIHFMNEYKSKFKHSFFIDGSSRESIQADIISHIRTASSTYSQASFSEAIDFLHNPYHQPSLLIYDNVDDIDLDIATLLPVCNNGVIIITTRNRSRGQLASPSTLHIELDVMSPEEAMDVVIRSSKLEPTDQNFEFVGQIASELGYLPVALVQAGSYIQENTSTAEEYLERLRDHKSEMMYTPAGDRLQRSSYAVFDISYDRLPPNVQNFLHLIGCIHFADFPLQIVVEGAKTKFTFEKFQFEDHDEEFDDAVKVLMDTFCPSGEWDSYTLDKMTRTLQNYSLASFTRSGIFKFLQMHPLVHQWVFERIKHEKRILFLHAAGRLITTASSEKNLYHYLSPHVSHLVSHSPNTSFSVNDHAAFGHVLCEVGRRRDARIVWEDIYRSLVEKGPEYELHVATAGMELAATLEDNLEEMENLEKKSIAIRERLLDPEHIDTLDAKKDLAGTYRRQRRMKEAEALQIDVLTSMKTRFGPTDAKVLEVAGWLALNYYQQGRYSDAEELQKHALEIRKERHGDTHANTVSAMSDLGATYHSQGHYSQAEVLRAQVLKIRREQLGDTHPDTVAAMGNLGVTYYSQSRYSEAVALIQQVLKVRREQLGDTHLDTVTAMNKLGSIYHSQGRYPEAVALQGQVLKIRKEQLGDTHLDTVYAMSSLAVTYHSQCRYSEAEALQEQVHKIQREQLGDTHLDTATAMSALGLTYHSQCRYSEAKALQEQVLKIQREQLGDTHLDTVYAMSSLAVTYHSQCRYSEAEALQEQVLKIQREQLGDTHLDTVYAMSSLAVTYHSQCRYSEAEALEEHVFRIRRDQLGETHLDTITAMSNLGSTYYMQGRYAEAETLEEQVLKIRREKLGDTHLGTLLAMNNLGWTCYYLGRLVQARELATQAEREGKGLLGIEHLDYKTIVQLLRLISQAEASSTSSGYSICGDMTASDALNECSLTDYFY